ncbi:MAG TPA: AAA family ATPase, partial [Candidatus Binatus sp.]|nr:AAA family ATPase [Candidatus Binatus sp.]
MILSALRLDAFRGYAALDAAFGPGPQLVWGPNAAGKTSLLEAMVVAAWGHSHRSTADPDLIAWGADVARVEVDVGGERLEVALVRPGSAAAAAGSRKRIRVNGVARRASALGERLRVVLFAPEDMLLIVGSPTLRRATIDRLAGELWPAYADALGRYGRALQQRNGLLRLIREESATRDELRYWDEPFLVAGAELVAGRHRLLAEL